MSRYRRTWVPGGTFFFTVNLADRGHDLLVEHVGTLHRVWRQVAQEHPFQTIAVCVMPEHLHAIWALPEGDADYSRRWAMIKAGFTHEIDAASRPALRTGSQRAHRDSGIWQRRFWEHQIRDANDLARHIDYIHFNPVKHGHVQQVREWPWSSVHRYIQRGILPAEWGEVEAADSTDFGERSP